MLTPVSSAGRWDGVTRLQDQELTYSPGHYLEGTPIPVGPDPYGYNYQAHIFNSYYPNAYLGRDGYPPYLGDLEAYDDRLVDEGYIIQGKEYDPVTLYQWQWSNYPEVWDLTKSDLVLKYTLDMSGIATAGWSVVEVGLREQGGPNIDPNDVGGWLLSVYKSAADSPVADTNDYHVLMKHGWLYEYYDYTDTGPMTATAPWTYINYAFHFDRGDVDEWQATYWNYKDGVTYNTGGVYEVEVTYHALDPTTATMFVKINGEEQGFYASGYDSGNPPDLMPVGRTFTGDMTSMQVFYGRGGGGGSVELTDVSVEYLYEDTPYDAWYWYPDVWLQMKWNDAWLANTDADDDGLLDRHLGYEDYIGSGAWLTNHQYPVEGDEWIYFVKIVAAPTEAVLVDGNWYVDGELMGYEIWGSFAVIQEVDENGLAYKADLPNGWGAYQP